MKSWITLVYLLDVLCVVKLATCETIVRVFQRRRNLKNHDSGMITVVIRRVLTPLLMQ